MEASRQTVRVGQPSGDPFDALGDPNRRAIVELLGGGERTVREIADALPISRPAVSRHLRLLKNAGLVVDQARGTRRLYQLHDQGVAAVQAYLTQVWGDTAARFRLMAENTTPQVDVPAESAPVPASLPGEPFPSRQSAAPRERRRAG